MECYFFLGDSARYYADEFAPKERRTLFTSYSLRSFLKKNTRIKFDLLILDCLTEPRELLYMLNRLEEEPCLPPVMLASSPEGTLPDSIKEHQLVKGIYGGPPLLDDLLREARFVLRRYKDSIALPFKGITEYYGMIGISTPIREVWAKIEKYSRERELAVLIEGENGTGKELVARALHSVEYSESDPFVSYQASSSGEDLMVSELMGVRKGAYTGSEHREGLLNLARNGVFFLDEIGLLSERNQIALLRVLQEKKVRPLGSSREIPVDFRLISATNVDIKEAVDDGRFREDLYYRVNGVKITVPPLRARKEDIPLLSEHFIGQRGDDKSFTASALDKLQNHDWPGNIRQLHNIVRRSAVECGAGERIEARHVIFN